MRMPDGAALARAKAAASATMSPAGAAEVPGTPCSPAASSGGCRWRARCAVRSTLLGFERVSPAACLPRSTVLPK
jgi:hypothetical protein